MPDDADDAALTSAIIAMGKILRLELIAEGVETAAQAEFLVNQGCHLHQGFLFSRPVPADKFIQLMNARVPPNVMANSRVVVNG